MPCLDKPLHELQEYRGINPRPGDFDTFWDNGLKELDNLKAHVELKPVDILGNVNAELFDLTFTGVGGARVYAKYLRPKGAQNCPAVIQFHGYSGSSGDWNDRFEAMLRYARRNDWVDAEGTRVRAHIVRN